MILESGLFWDEVDGAAGPQRHVAFEGQERRGTKWTRSGMRGRWPTMISTLANRFLLLYIEHWFVDRD